MYPTTPRCLLSVRGTFLRSLSSAGKGPVHPSPPLTPPSHFLETIRPGDWGLLWPLCSSVHYLLLVTSQKNKPEAFLLRFFLSPGFLL